MKPIPKLLALAALTGLGALAVFAEDKAERANVPPEGFTALFNGKDLTGWQGLLMVNEPGPTGKGRNIPAWLSKMSAEDLAAKQKEANDKVLPHWKVLRPDGVLSYDGKGNSLQTVKLYGNFELLLDWKIEEKGDSGIYIRGQPQVQVWDSDKSPGARNEDVGTGSGGLWNNPLPPDAARSKDNSVKLKEGQKIGKIPLKKADKPVGEWNTFRIIMKGDKVTVYLNGELVVDNAALANYWDRGKPLPKKGPIELQHHGDKLWFRNIFIKELPDDTE